MAREWAVLLCGVTMILPVLSCDGCGMCCYIQRVPPYMETELDALPRELLKEWMRVSEGVAEGTEGPCVWLNGEKKCSHYEERPEVCRQFEMGGEECREVRERLGWEEGRRCARGGCQERCGSLAFSK